MPYQCYSLIVLMLVGIIWNVRDVLGGEPTCSVYIGKDGVCSNYIGNSDYIYLNGTVELMDIENSLENLIIAQGLSVLSNASIPCVKAFTSYACAVAYPKCLADISKQNPQIASISLPCKSTCEKVQTECLNSQDKVVLSYIKTSFLFPKNCNIIPQESSLNISYPKSNCNQEEEINFAPRCFPPLVEDTLFTKNNSQSLNSDFCGAGCCLPCPQSYFLYPEGYMDKGFLVTQIIRAISSLAAFIVMVSYIILPGKRNYPNSLILFASVSIFLYSSVVFFSIGDPRKIQCVGVNHSTQINNNLCAVQGALLIFATHATAIWVGIIILNLHLYTVWNLNFLSNKQIWLNCLGWGVPLFLTVMALISQSVNYQFGTLCLVKRSTSGVILFYPLAVIVVPSFIIHIITFLHIAKATQRSRRSRKIVSNFSELISHKKHVLQAVKIQWRALLLAIILVGTVTFYWLFYFVELSRFTSPNKSFESEWVQCIQSGGGQNECSKISQRDMPSFGLLITTELVAGLIGIWLFILFSNYALWQDWRLWISEKFKEKLEPDQFFAI
ncbi:6953_t:CDS:2 [Diversispora eburnea]|uniref:6953_t:CDS:1 n=1 Tax=Diversispora eburnea TaxID=1213867 RepID=A0A9N8V8G1_9GLOM|nr:6953_t:CDS:2 [Diversispora eburnea]